MTEFTTRNRISAAVVCFYVPTLFFASYLTIRHGLGRNAAWIYLCAFAGVRIIGASLELASINQPFNIDIHVAGMIFQNIGISPLMLIIMALVGRTLATVRHSRTTIIKPIQLRFVQFIIFLGLILVIVGGVRAGDTFKKTFQFHLPVLGKVGLSLIIAGFGLLVMAAIYVSTIAAHIAAGEKRLLLAVWLSFPFLVVRVVYGSMGAYTRNPRFNQLTGDANTFLGMAMLMEVCVSVICMAIGSTMPTTPFSQQAADFRDMKQTLKAKLSRNGASQETTESQQDSGSQSEGTVEKGHESV